FLLTIYMKNNRELSRVKLLLILATVLTITEIIILFIALSVS
ncbi:putative membrane protein, partial [Escherichia coli TW09195]